MIQGSLKLGLADLEVMEVGRPERRLLREYDDVFVILPLSGLPQYLIQPRPNHSSLGNGQAMPSLDLQSNCLSTHRRMRTLAPFWFSVIRPLDRGECVARGFVLGSEKSGSVMWGVED